MSKAQDLIKPSLMLFTSNSVGNNDAGSRGFVSAMNLYEVNVIEASNLAFFEPCFPLNCRHCLREQFLNVD